VSERGPQRRVSEDEARRLWARAAELQAESLARRDALPSSDALDPDDGSSTRAGDDAGLPAADPGYELAQVRDAAREAGIAEQFLERALAEADAGALAGGEKSGGLTDRYLGPGPLWIEVDESVEHPVAEVFTALRRVTDRLQLALIDSRGDPKNGGVLVFERSGVDALLRHQVLKDFYNHSITQVHVSLEPLSADACRLRIGASLASYRRLMGGFGVALNLIAAGVVGVGAAALAPGALVTGAGALLGVAVGLPSAAATGFGVRRLWRRGHRSGEKNARGALGSLLRMIVTDARTGGLFPLPKTTGTATASGLDDVDDLLDSLL
jgi:hypothetical protein